MTIAISMKINDGLVLAADSASTVVGQDPLGNLFAVNVYNNANKVFNLLKGAPIGAITWGAGSIGNASISSVVKDFRRQLSTGDGALNPNNYSIEEVATRFKAFVFDDRYQPAFREVPNKPALGFIVAGYSTGVDMPDEYRIDIQNGECHGPKRLRETEESGMTWAGEPEAMTRLVLGFSPQLPGVLTQDLGVPPDQVGAAMQVLQQKLQLGLVFPAMPLQDALDLAEFMVETTIKFSRFTPGAPSVGGPIELAAISKHEGFRWVKRKLYYTSALNPEQK